MMQGWDKTYCLQFVEKDYDEIHFFGDKTFPVSVANAACAAVPTKATCYHDGSVPVLACVPEEYT